MKKIARIMSPPGSNGWRECATPEAEPEIRRDTLRAPTALRQDDAPGNRGVSFPAREKRMNELITQYGLALVFANVLLEQLGLPIPAIPTLIVAGALSAEGKFSAWGIFGVAFVACMIGDGLWYLAGRRYGRRVMTLLCRMSLSPDSCVRQTEVRFERWGALT